MPDKQQNQHIRRVVPEKHWVGGGLAQLLRLPSILGFLSVGSLSQGAMWLWKVAPIWVSSAGLATVVVISAGLFVLRRVYLRYLETHASLLKFCQAISQASVLRKNGVDIQGAQSIYQTIASNTENVFRTVRRDPTLGAALRLSKKANGSNAFVSVAWSGHHARERSQTSQHIPEGQGIPHVLATKGGGVYVLDNIQSAADKGDWYCTTNDALGEVTYALVTLVTMPLAHGIDIKPATLGVLSVTSKKKPFTPGLETATLEICAHIATQGLAFELQEHKYAAERDKRRNPDQSGFSKK